MLSVYDLWNKKGEKLRVAFKLHLINGEKILIFLVLDLLITDYRQSWENCLTLNFWLNWCISNNYISFLDA